MSHAQPVSWFSRDPGGSTIYVKPEPRRLMPDWARLLGNLGFAVFWLALASLAAAVVTAGVVLVARMLGSAGVAAGAREWLTPWLYTSGLGLLAVLVPVLLTAWFRPA